MTTLDEERHVSDPIPEHWSTQWVQVATFVHYYPDIRIDRIAAGLDLPLVLVERACRMLCAEGVLVRGQMGGRYSSAGTWSPDVDDAA